MVKKIKSRYPVVMLIDDNEIDNFINERMIRGCAFSEKIYVNSGTKSAIEFLKNISNTESTNLHYPELIFLDINMPLMDGFMFIEEFEKIKLKSSRTRIILLTSSLSPEDELKSKKYNVVSNFVRKPLTEETLANL